MCFMSESCTGIVVDKSIYILECLVRSCAEEPIPLGYSGGSVQKNLYQTSPSLRADPGEPLTHTRLNTFLQHTTSWKNIVLTRQALHCSQGFRIYVAYGMIYIRYNKKNSWVLDSKEYGHVKGNGLGWLYQTFTIKIHGSDVKGNGLGWLYQTFTILSLIHI